MAIRRLRGDDWAAYREIRLAALLADPAAFASSHEREAQFDEATWRRRITVGPTGRELATFVVEHDGAIVGTAAGIFLEEDDAPMLVAMWVAPDARRTGSGRGLVEAVCDWATEQGADEITLWVVRGNAAATRLYESCGFRTSGNVQTLPADSTVEEIEMRRPLS